MYIKARVSYICVVNSIHLSRAIRSTDATLGFGRNTQVGQCKRLITSPLKSMHFLARVQIFFFISKKYLAYEYLLKHYVDEFLDDC